LVFILNAACSAEKQDIPLVWLYNQIIFYLALFVKNFIVDIQIQSYWNGK
jgi:hypothetical protein